MPVPADVSVAGADSAGVAIVVGVELSTTVMSFASAPPSSTSATSQSLRPLAPLPGALALRPSAVQFTHDVGPAVFVVRLYTSLLLLPRASLVACAVFAYLLLTAIWIPAQLGSFSCVYLRREPCVAMHATILHFWVLVWSGPEQLLHVRLHLHLLSMWPHPQQWSHLLFRLTFVNGSTRCHTSAAVMPSLTSHRTTFTPCTTKTIDNTEISPL